MKITQKQLRHIIKEELTRSMNEMGMSQEEEEAELFGRRPSQQNLDHEKYMNKIMRNKMLRRFSAEGGFSLEDVIDMFSDEMSNDLDQMGVDSDERALYDEVHDMLDIMAVEGHLDLDPKNPDMYTFMVRRMGPRRV